MIEISKTYKFCAAHALPHLPWDHKCRKLHGHNYTATFYLQGEIDPTLGWVKDFGEISTVVAPVIDRLDHSELSAILAGASTAENLAVWLFREVKDNLPQLVAVEVRETESTSAIYRPGYAR